jgi:hypothetical protein
LPALSNVLFTMLQALRKYVPVFLVALLCLVPLYVVTKNLSFRFDTDYKAVIPAVGFAISAVGDPLHFFTWNPFVGLGIPVLGDPSSILFSPWYMPIFLILGADTGLRVLIALSMIVAGFTMWVFLSSLGVNNRIAVWGAALYELSGGFAALVTSGRIERFGSYAAVPYVMYLMWKHLCMHVSVFGYLYAMVGKRVIRKLSPL